MWFSGLLSLLSVTDSKQMLQQLYESAGIPYLLDRGLGCHSTGGPRWEMKGEILRGLSRAPDE